MTRTIEVETSTLPEKCANLICTNKLGEGGFKMVAIGPVRLLLCFPCADRLVRG